MTAIPAKSAFTGASVTEGDFKTSLETLIDYLTGMLGSSGTQAAALQSLGALGGTITTISTDRTVVAADRGKIFSCIGWRLISLTSAATLGSGFVVAFVNADSGVCTIDPVGSETVNGNATWTLNAGDSVALVSNGVNWLVVAGYIKPATPKQSGMQAFTSNGTFYVPDGVTRVKVTVVGGGAGGGDVRGGGGAGISIKNISGLTPGAAIAVTVGAAGSGRLNGNSSSFGGYCTANGGFANGNGGTATGGDINLSGGLGGPIQANAFSGGGGAGGASGTFGIGYGPMGSGGAGMFGSGGDGNASASGYGNGGGGGALSGSPGIVIVEW